MALLDDYGADATMSDNRGWTPLHHGAQQGYATVVGHLLKGTLICALRDKRKEIAALTQQLMSGDYRSI